MGIRFLIAAAVTSVVICATTSADIVVDHQPYNYGGLASDTDFLFGSTPVWQRVADDFRLTDSAIIRKVVFGGFYDRDNPPASETMRMRILGARADDGLPDESAVVHEESFLNPSRVATGRFIFVGISPDEYRYELDLSMPVALEAETDYWLEIAQIGDRTTMFRWEDSLAEINGHAFVNSNFDDWQNTGGNYTDLAFQLSTIPEPGTLGFLLLAALTFPKRRVRKRGGAMR